MQGRLLRLAVTQEPELAKAWAGLADWAYQLGQRVMEQAGEREGRTQLSQEERAAVLAVLGTGENPVSRAVLSTVAQVGSLTHSFLNI